MGDDRRQLNVFIPGPMHRLLEQYSRRSGKPVAAMVREALREYLSVAVRAYTRQEKIINDAAPPPLPPPGLWVSPPPPEQVSMHHEGPICPHRRPADYLGKDDIE